MNSFYVITDWPLDGWESEFLSRLTLKEGIHAKRLTLLSQRPPDADMSRADCGEVAAGLAALRAEISTAQPTCLFILGETLLAHFTGREGIDKWHCSALRPDPLGPWIIPALPVSRVTADMSQQVWLTIAVKRAARAFRGEIKESNFVYLLNPPVEQVIAHLDLIRGLEGPLSVDIETGRGQINTVGFAWQSRGGPEHFTALAINTLPSRLGLTSFHEVWRRIADIIQSDQPKILQNFIYETLYFSRYGIYLNGVTHDTMIAQKFLWPEFEMGLDAVGRMYTDMPYWKDDGKSWNNIRDWEKHYEYNCKDTTGTYQGYLGQVTDLRERGLSALYSGYVTRLFPRVAEMCSNGLPVADTTLSQLRTQINMDLERELILLRGLPGAEKLNARSPLQVKKFLTASPRNYKLPKKYSSAKKNWGDSTDERSLKKLKSQYPRDEALQPLLNIAKLGKCLSSYLNAHYDTDGRMRYSLTAGGTETFRMAGHCDPWDRGVNPQTVPGGSKGINVKRIFQAPPEAEFIQIDLKQAESRFVAYDSADLNLIRALEDPARDIHSEVAVEICQMLGRDPVAERAEPKHWKYHWRQLGKKSGHSANYCVGPDTFIDACLQEMELKLTRDQGRRILEAYHTLFPGIRKWHHNLRQELCQRRVLKTPWGWERYFYGRMNDATFREAYAFRPQSTIPYIINQLMLHLCNLRASSALTFKLLLQCHDSLLLEAPLGEAAKIKAAAECYGDWQPGFDLAGGHLIIPIDMQRGLNWGNLDE